MTILATRTIAAFTFNFAASSDEEGQATVQIVYRGEVKHTGHFSVNGEKTVAELLENLSEKDEIFLVANSFQEWMEACKMVESLPEELVELFGLTGSVVFPYDTDDEADAEQFKADADEFLAILTERVESAE